MVFEQLDINIKAGRLLVENHIEIDKFLYIIFDLGIIRLRNLYFIPLKLQNYNKSSHSNDDQSNELNNSKE
jgi:hypothetical protein